QKTHSHRHSAHTHTHTFNANKILSLSLSLSLSRRRASPFENALVFFFALRFVPLFLAPPSSSSFQSLSEFKGLDLLLYLPIPLCVSFSLSSPLSNLNFKSNPCSIVNQIYPDPFSTHPTSSSN
ncbi:hypothetical protein F2P56_006954, partial [Juglans regia]